MGCARRSIVPAPSWRARLHQCGAQAAVRATRTANALRCPLAPTFHDDAGPMTDFLAALLLGIIEGITEFLPISSTGHLLIAERWLGHRSDLFNIAIQAGAILAVVLIYRERLWQLADAFLHPAKAQTTVHGQAPRDYAWKLAAAFGVTAVLGVIVKKLGFELPEDVQPIAWALIIGAIWMVIAEQLAARRAQALGERTQITWLVAILVGVA